MPSSGIPRVSPAKDQSGPARKSSPCDARRGRDPRRRLDPPGDEEASELLAAGAVADCPIAEERQPAAIRSEWPSLLKTNTAGRHYRNAGAKQERVVIRGALSDVVRFDHLADVDPAAAPA